MHRSQVFANYARRGRVRAHNWQERIPSAGARAVRVFCFACVSIRPSPLYAVVRVETVSCNYLCTQYLNACSMQQTRTRACKRAGSNARPQNVRSATRFLRSTISYRRLHGASTFKLCNFYARARAREHTNEKNVI